MFSSILHPQVPPELKKVLVDYIIKYLTDKPEDMVEHAYNHFVRLREQRGMGKMESRITWQATEDEHPIKPRPGRRKSVWSEKYDPEMDTEEFIPKIFPKTDLQKTTLMSAMKDIFIFRALDHCEVGKVADAMFELKVSSGEEIIKQGDDGDYFYIIEAGRFEATIREEGNMPRTVKVYEGKGSFGELALLYNQPRAATITSLTPGNLWAVDRMTFRKIVLKGAFKKRKMYESFISNVPMLNALESYELMDLADALEPRYYDDGDQIIEQGAPADGMFFVEQGSVLIKMKDRYQNETRLKELVPGEYFGELALVTHRPRAASAYAIGKTKLAYLDVDAFERLLGPCISILKRNIDVYEAELHKIFGSKEDIVYLR